MKRIDLIQGSVEWLEHRYGKIGGTRAKQLHVKSENLLIELLSESTEDFEQEDGFTSKDMERGNELEPYAVIELNKYTGLEFNSVGWLQHDTIKLLGISPDGITDDNKASCEIKCPAKKKHTSTVYYDEIPLDNLHQCIQYFVVNKELERHFFCSFRPENKIKQLFVKELTPESIVNLGTKAKPKNKTIKEWVLIIEGLAIELQKDLDLAIEKISF